MVFYSNNMEGIRVGVEFEEDKLERIFELIEDPTTKSLISKDLDFDKTLPFVASPRAPFYRKMEYTGNRISLKPSILNANKDGIKIDMSKVALYKSTEWKFQ